MVLKFSPTSEPFMKTWRTFFLLLLTASALTVSAAPPASFAAFAEAYPDPARFEKDIQALEKRPITHGAVVAYGSSTIRLWKTIHVDFAPLTVLQRGFGGSNMADALFYADRILIPARPRAVLLYEGDNDINIGVSPEMIHNAFEALTTHLHTHLPDTRVYFLAIKPSLARWEKWPDMQKANRLIAERCAADPRLFFIDVATPMFGDDGKPRADLLVGDRLHLSPMGYTLWAAVARNVINPVESPHEGLNEK